MTNSHKSTPRTANDPGSQQPGSEDISIVMAVYNHQDTVAEALDSALMQEMPYTSRIYCLNDASTDNSAEILSDYANRYPDKIKIFTSPENQGSGKQSFLFHRPPVKGRYWCLLAGDDYWTSREKLAKQIAFLDNSSPRFVGCSCNTVMRNETTGEEGIIKPDRNTWNLLDLMLQDCPLYVHTSSITWRNIYQDQGSFLPPPFKVKGVRGDVMLMHMMLYKGGKIQNIPEVMSCYRVTGRGVWTKKSAMEQEEENCKLAKLLDSSIPLRYKILFRLRVWWRHFKDKFR